MALRQTASDRLNLVLVAVCLLLLVFGAGLCLSPELFPSPQEISIRRIIHAIHARDPHALELGRQHLATFPDDSLGLALYADAAARNSDHHLALQLYEQLGAREEKWALRSHLGLARRYEILGRLTEAEHHLRQALARAPSHVEANSRLGYLLQVQGRNWEAAEHYFTIIRRGKCRGDELIGLAIPERFFLLDERLERLCPTLEPPEPLINLALARSALYQNRMQDAERLLRLVIQDHPEIGEAQGRLGRIIVDRAKIEEFLSWLAQVPPEARDHPEVWFAQGLQARRLGQLEGAVNCFLRTLSLSPNHLAANVQISGCLERLGQSKAASEFARRGELLAELDSNLNLVRNHSDPALMGKLARILSRLGRNWEAAGWCYVIKSFNGQEPLIRQQRRDVTALALQSGTPADHRFLPARLLKGQRFKSPRWPSTKTDALPPDSHSTSGVSSPVSKEADVWNFVDDADRLGIRFSYYEGTTEQNRMQHIFNTMGGGLGAIDFDNDGWTDLYLAQANNWLISEPQPEHFDRLYRNQVGQHFQDITTHSLIHEVDFSHGVTVADFDQDGFSDLYINNKGPNRLYRNNGDGTFEDVTERSGTAGNEWSTSSILVDLNGDQYPDLYVLNYSLLKETAEKICRNAHGVQVGCTPDLLIAEVDRCYLNRGDGTFQEISKESGIDLSSGKGLGIIAWDFAGNGRTSLFVANDSTPNFLFVNTEQSDDGVPRFQEEALVRGIAVDIDGNALASMGVAAGDVTGDGRIDLFVTTFFGESKTLFSQQPDGLFNDLTRPFELRNPGFWMLGFGCQFADLDGDGWEDIITTNGHVDQKSYRGDPDRMPPQIFQNVKGQRFREVPRHALGPFFQGNYLGRGLAKLDWNRDGQVDVAISHLHSPFALLTNDCQIASLPLTVKLVGRNGCRDPIGATIEVRWQATRLENSPSMASTGSTQQSREMERQIRLCTGGDGFLVTNERSWHFSIPSDQTAVEIAVTWPDGQTEIWPNVTSGQEILIIEGARQPWPMQNYSKVSLVATGH